MAIEPVTCSRPPALTEDELEAVLLGAADASVEEHLVQCPYCAARLKALQRFERTLQVRLARQGCPSVSMLGDYALGLLDAGTQSWIEDHLESCVSCARELHVIQDALSDRTAARTAARTERQRPRQPDSFADKLRRLVNDWQRRVAALLAPSPRVALRGSDQAERIVAATARERVILESVLQGDRRRLTGQVLSEDVVAWNSALVEVYHGDDLAATAFLDDLNEFVCDGLTASSMRVMITAVDGRQIVIPDARFDS